MKELIAERVKGMALIGEAKDRMFAALGGLTESAKLGSLEEAVSWARSKARPGEIVLLSPACSSYECSRITRSGGSGSRKSSTLWNDPAEPEPRKMPKIR